MNGCRRIRVTWQRNGLTIALVASGIVALSAAGCTTSTSAEWEAGEAPPGRTTQGGEQRAQGENERGRGKSRGSERGQRREAQDARARGGGEGTQSEGQSAGGGSEVGAEPGTEAGTKAGAPGDDPDNPWGATRAEKCKQKPRPSMNGSAKRSFEQGLRAASNGDIASARRSFKAALQADRKAFRAAYNLGVLADREGNPNQALEQYRKALRIQGDYEDAAEGIVRIYLRRGSVPEALAFVEPKAKQHTANEALQALYAEVLVKAERYDDAWKAARQALRCNETSVPGRIALVKASLAEGREELAKTTLDQALKIDDKNAELHYLKANMLLGEAGRRGDAIEHLEKAVKIRPDYLEARMTLGVQRLQGATYDQALKHFKKAAELAPKMVSVHLNLGDAYRANDMWEKAKQEFDRALELDPNLADAYFNMGLMYMEAGKDYPGLDKLEAMQKAVEMFKAGRDKAGPQPPGADQTEAYLTKLQRQIEREKVRRKRAEQREARQKAGGSGSGSGSGGSGGSGGGGSGSGGSGSGGQGSAGNAQGGQ